jgi:hypothetical protein
VDYYRQRMRSMRELRIRKQFAIVRQALAEKIRHIAHPFSGRVETSWSQAYWPGKEFKAPHFRAPVALFKRPKQPFFYVRDETMGWASRSAGGVEVQSIDFPHRMLREPYVRELASHLKNCLARAASVKNSEKERLWEPVSSESRLPVGS